MNNRYEDIRSRITEAPSWWDERAVPRYGAFAPGQVANIYAQECCLLLIACQNCGYKLQAAMSWDTLSLGLPRLQLRALVGSLEYGDPPNVDCCAAGPTMTSVTQDVLEFWQRVGGHGEWRRRPDLEGKARVVEWAGDL